MFHSTRCRYLVTAALLASPQPLLAELSAADFWAAQTAVLNTLGGETTSSVVREGNVETRSDINFAFALPFDAGTIGMSMTDLRLTENDDGSLTMEYVEPVRLDLSAEITGEGRFGVGIELEFQDHRSVVTGEPGDIMLDYFVGQMTLSVTDIEASGDELDDMLLKISGDFSDMSGQTNITLGDLIALAATTSIGSQKIEYEFTDPTGGFVTGTGGAGQMTTRSDIDLPSGGLDIMNLAAALQQGLRFTVDAEVADYTNGQTTRVDGEVLASQITETAEQKVRYNFDHNGLVADILARDSYIEMTLGPILPAPLSARIADMSSVLELPVSASEDPQDMRIQANMEGLSLGEGIWAMFDPGQALPRDPATVSLDLSGKVRNLVDWLNFPQVQALFESGGVPAEPLEMTVNQLEISAVGARLQGSGDLEFDNSAMPAGPPIPFGTVDLSLSGANGLIDTLIAMGLVQEADAMGARMMMGMVAVPDPSGAEDALVSKIEMTRDGQILANGQRLK